MKYGIVIPCGGDSLRHYQMLPLVFSAYQELGWPVVIGTSHPFVRSRARNRGARALADTEVLIFNDADSFCALTQIRQAAHLAYKEPGLVFAFTDYVRLNERGAPDWHMTDSGSSGCIAIRRECFEEVGGYDERYTGHGFEDLDFANRCAELWPLRRVPGKLTHFWHPRPAAEENEHNRELYEARWAKSTA